MTAIAKERRVELADILGLNPGSGEYQRRTLYNILETRGSDPVKLPGWAEAPLAGYLVCKYVERLHVAELTDVVPPLLELFSGTFWRRAAWGKLRILGYTDHASSAEARELVEDPPWVLRDRCQGWSLSTALFAGGFLALVTYDEGPYRFDLWLEVETHNGDGP